MKDLYDNMGKQELNDVIIYKSMLEETVDTRGVFYKGNAEKPPIKSGRFFSDEDYFGECKVAVIGSGFIEKTVSKNNKRYIEILGEEFEVIGVLGKKQSSRFDTMKWIPLDTAISLSGTEGKYYIDGKNKQTIERNSNHLKEILLEDCDIIQSGSDSINITSAESQGNGLKGIFDKLFDRPDTITVSYYAIIMAFVLTTIFITANWISYRRQVIQVKRMAGCSKLGIYLSVLKSYFLIVIISVCVSYLGVLIMHWIYWIYTPLWSDIVISFLFVLVLGVIIFSIYLLPILQSKEVILSR